MTCFAQLRLRRRSLLNGWNKLPHCTMAGGQGFEPRFMEPESIVLPLDDPPFFVPVPTRRSPRSERDTGVIRAPCSDKYPISSRIFNTINSIRYQPLNRKVN